MTLLDLFPGNLHFKLTQYFCANAERRSCRVRGSVERSTGSLSQRCRWKRAVVGVQLPLLWVEECGTPATEAAAQPNYTFRP